MRVALSPGVVGAAVLEYVLLEPELVAHFLAAEPALSDHHLAAVLEVFLLLGLVDDLHALLALLEQVSVLAVMDVVLGQLGDLHHLRAVLAGGQVPALFEAVQVVQVGVLEPGFGHSAVLAAWGLGLGGAGRHAQ